MKRATFRDYGWSSSWFSINQYADCYPWWNPRRYRVRGRLRDAWYYFKCWAWRRHNQVTATTLTPTYHDAVELLLHVNFQILCNFIEHEQPFERTMLDHATTCATPTDVSGCCPSCNADVVLGRELRALYRWWTEEREVHLQEYEDMLSAWSAARGPMRWEPVSQGLSQLVTTPNAEADRLFLMVAALEQRNDATDQAMLHRLIDIRQGLWT